MPILSLFFFSFLCIVIQVSPVLNACFPVKPDLTIPLILYFCLFQNPLSGFFLAVWVGFLLDFFSGSTGGVFLFLRVGLFFLIYEAKNILFLENKVLWVPLIGLLLGIDHFLAYLLFLFTEKNQLNINLTSILARAGFTLFLSGLIFPIYYKVDKIILANIKRKAANTTGTI